MRVCAVLSQSRSWNYQVYSVLAVKDQGFDCMHVRNGQTKKKERKKDGLCARVLRDVLENDR